jgi:hypothetical protein
MSYNVDTIKSNDSTVVYYIVNSGKLSGYRFKSVRKNNRESIYCGELFICSLCSIYGEYFSTQLLISRMKKAGITIDQLEKIADSNQIEYFESENFESDYLDILYTDLEPCYCKERLFELYKNDDVASADIKYFCNNIKEVFHYNLLPEYKRFSNYYVGDYCIASLSFGEMEIELCAIGNNEINDFCISGEYGYYDLSSNGLYITLEPEKFNELVKKLWSLQNE